MLSDLSLLLLFSSLTAGKELIVPKPKPNDSPTAIALASCVSLLLSAARKISLLLTVSFNSSKVLRTSIPLLSRVS